MVIPTHLTFVPNTIICFWNYTIPLDNLIIQCAKNQSYCVFFLIPGRGMSELSLADRATIANMSPEYGATMGFFPVDHVTLQYLKLTGRSDENVSYH